MEILFDPKPQAKAFLNVNSTFACGFGSNDQPCQDLRTTPLSVRICTNHESIQREQFEVIGLSFGSTKRAHAKAQRREEKAGYQKILAHMSSYGVAKLLFESTVAMRRFGG